MANRGEKLDPRYRERLAASTLLSLFFHALFAVLFFAVIVSSSREGTTENVSGGEVITLEKRTSAIVANRPSAVLPAPPVPHVPRIAPERHAPQLQPEAQKLPQNRHELAREAPTAPPNPKPLPQREPQPNPQPTQNIFEVQPRNELPAAPVTVATVAPVSVAIKTPPTAPPSPVPSAVPSAKPSPRPPSPTMAPSAKPSTPAPVVPSASPTAAAIASRTTAVPSSTPAPAAHASQPPAEHPGVPSPSPTNGPAVAKTTGTAPSPGPKGTGSPGPVRGTSKESKPSAPRPIEVRPTPTPAPRPTATPKPGAIDLNAKLRAMLPSGPVNPNSKQYTPQVNIRGSMNPTPPPEVLAQTKYLYQSRNNLEGKTVMWVTSVRKVGPTTVCTGWLVRYPLNATAVTSGEVGRQAIPAGQPPIGGSSGSQLSIGGRAGSGYLAPVVDGLVTQACEGRWLTPYAGSATPSP